MLVVFNEVTNHIKSVHWSGVDAYLNIIYKYMYITLDVHVLSVCLQVSSIFNNKEFCVINGSPTLSKSDIETKIAEVTTMTS